VIGDTFQACLPRPRSLTRIESFNLYFSSPSTPYRIIADTHLHDSPFRLGNILGSAHTASEKVSHPPSQLIFDPQISDILSSSEALRAFTQICSSRTISHSHLTSMNRQLNCCPQGLTIHSKTKRFESQSWQPSEC
jgi:hypothetical protein